MKHIFKKSCFYILVFLVPASILFLVYALRGVYPFGQNSVLVLDLNAQYIYYYEAFRDAFYDGKSLFYSFSRTLGGEMAGIYAYYLASPFSFILLIFPKSFITEAVLCIILLKVGMASLTFALYLKTRWKPDNLTVLIFSLMYSLMSYMIVQTMNPMWLDGLIFLPVMAMGVERLVDKGKYGLFIISLAAMFVSNFYIGYMTGIFVFFYFLYYIFSSGTIQGFREKARKLFAFSGSALLAAGLSMWLLLPTYYSLAMGKFGFTSPDFTPVQKADFFDLFSKLLPLTYDSVNYQGYPFIFCGTIGLILAVLYFTRKDIAARKKAAAASFIGLFIICFTVSTVDISLHGFQAPNWLNFRYSFVLPFFLLILAYETYGKINEVDKKNITSVCIALLFLTALTGKMQYEFIKPERALWLGYTCVISYSVLLYVLRNDAHKKEIKRYNIISVVISLMVAAEMGLNTFAMIDGAHKEVYYSDRPSYREYFYRLKPAADYIKQSDDSFYRAETVIRRTVNDPMALGINGISHSSSTLNSAVLDTLFKLGVCAREHWSRYKGTTTLTDSVFGIKYIISENSVNGSYEPVFSENNLSVYKNPNALPVAFTVSSEYAGLSLDSTDPFINQNALLSAMLGEQYTEYFKLLPINEIIFENMTGTEEEGFVAYNAIDPSLNAHIEYILGTAGENEMYMYLYSEYPRKVNLWKNREFLDTFFDSESTCIMPLGAFPDEESISLITTPIEGEYYLSNNMFYYLDTPLFEDAVRRLSQNDTDLDKLNETHIRISVAPEDSSILFTSIPYEKGWRVRINGEKVKPLKAVDSLLAVELTAGEQLIELRFIPYGFIAGCIISAAAVVIFIFLMLYLRRNPAR